MEVFLVAWFLCGIGAAVVASNRGAGGCLWFGLGVLLGPIGFALAFTTGTRCEKCGSNISSKAEICSNCGHEMIAPIVRSVRAATRACPFCAETILAAAKKCKHCGEFLSPLEPTAIQKLPVPSVVEQIQPSPSPEPIAPRAWANGEWVALLFVIGLVALIVLGGVFGGTSEKSRNSPAQKTSEELTPDQTEQNRRDVQELIRRSRGADKPK